MTMHSMEWEYLSICVTIYIYIWLLGDKTLQRLRGDDGRPTISPEVCKSETHT